tara:strand:+ start:63 stop:584 length:522 start_codon:yes stop_codon:yes gene_type:complete
MLSFIEEVDSSTKFTIECFNGAVIFECRMLSPLEAEAAGMSTSMVASAMMDPAQIAKIIKNKDKLSSIDFTDPNEEELQTILNMMDGFKPEQLLSIEEQQNKILCQVVKRASEDNGVTYQIVHLVQGYDQQDASNNRLWVGSIPKDDRTAILNQAMNSHREAVESLNNFRKSG